MILLLVAGMVNCLLGLSGNVVGMTGHATWNLINSVTVAGINFVLNWILITAYGLIGAALATCIASIIVIIMLMVEINYLVNVRICLRLIYKPFLAILPPLVFIILFQNRLNLLVYRIIAGVLILGVYVLLLKLLKFKGRKSESQK